VVLWHQFGNLIVTFYAWSALYAEEDCLIPVTAEVNASSVLGLTVQT
jgi:hypothetical protein